MNRESHTYPMSMAYRFCFLLGGGLGAFTLVTLGLEWAGLVAADTFLEGASQTERIVAALVGAWLLPFSITGWLNGRLVLHPDRLDYLKFGVICGQGTLALRDVRRFGEGTVSAGAGRRDRILLFELDSGERRSIKLSMYRDQGDLLRELAGRLEQEAVPTTAGWKGLKFADD